MYILHREASLKPYIWLFFVGSDPCCSQRMLPRPGELYPSGMIGFDLPKWDLRKPSHSGKDNGTAGCTCWNPRGCLKIPLWNFAHNPTFPFLLTHKKLKPLARFYPKLALFIHSQATKTESNLSNRFHHVESIVMKPKLQLTEFWIKQSTD